MYKIKKEFHFCASHKLEGLAEDHPCSNLHGHNYIIEVVLTSRVLDKVGMIVDYRELDRIKKYIDIVLDHTHLNDIFDFNPTAENIAEHLFFRFKGWYGQVSAVSVKETPKTSATYYA